MDLEKLLEEAIQYGEQGNEEKVLELAEKLMETNATHYYYRFARDVKFAPIDKIVEKIIYKKDDQIAAVMIKNVKGIKIKGLLEMITEPCITLNGILNSETLGLDQKVEAIAFYMAKENVTDIVNAWLKSFDLKSHLATSGLSKEEQLVVLLKLGQIDPDAITTLKKTYRISVISHWLASKQYDAIAQIIDNSLMENRKTLRFFLDDGK